MEPQSNRLIPLEKGQLPDTDLTLPSNELLAKLMCDPQYAHLVEMAQKGKTPRRTLWAKLLALFLASPEEFHGKTYVTPKLKQDAATSANLVSASNLIDFSTNWPLLFYAFTDLGTVGSLLASGLINMGLLKFGNDVAAGVASNRAGNRAWSCAAAGGMLALNTVLSLGSAVGTELLNNQPTLARQKAGQIIEEQIDRVEKLKTISNPRYQTVKARCEAGRAELATLARSHPRWDSLFVEIFGPWAEKDKDWSRVDLERLPTCRQVTRLEQEAFRAYETAKANLEERLQKRIEIGNDVVFLQVVYPELYAQTFTADGRLKSGVEAIQFATDNFFSNLQAGNFGRIGFSLFFFSLSVLTSATACFSTITYAMRQDTQRSWNDRVRRERDRWLEQQWHTLLEEQQQQAAQKRN